MTGFTGGAGLYPIGSLKIPKQPVGIMNFQLMTAFHPFNHSSLLLHQIGKDRVG